MIELGASEQMIELGASGQDQEGREVPYVWECHVHGKQAISFTEPDLLRLTQEERLPVCPKEGCEQKMGYSYKE